MLSTETLRIIFDLFLFKLKQVEIVLRDARRPPEEVESRLKGLRFKIRVVVIVFFVTMVAYSTFAIVKSYFHAQRYYVIDKFFNIFEFVPFDLMKIYLYIHFWRMGDWLVKIL